MMPMPAEDAYFEIGGDQARFWSTARKSYVPPDDLGLAAWLATGRTVIGIISEAELSATLANIGLGPLAPIPSPGPRDPLAELDALTAALVTKAVITDADVAAAAASLDEAAPVNPVIAPLT